MDEILENFCNLITPSVQTCEEVTENTEKLVHLLKRKSNYPVNRWKIIEEEDLKKTECSLSFPFK